MGHSEQNTDNGVRGRLMETARALVLRGDSKFSISSLCREAGVDRAEFHNHFGGKTALMAAVMQSQSRDAEFEISPKISEIPAAPQTVQAVAPAPNEPVSEPTPKAEQISRPPVSTPPPSLHRPLTVF